eukprot:g4045.t1
MSIFGGMKDSMKRVVAFTSFGKVELKDTHILRTSARGSSVVLTGLAPIMKSHCICVPKDRKEKLAQLTSSTILDLMNTVRETMRTLVASNAGISAFNVAVKDGCAAGQPVPHVHVHVVPRSKGDLKDNDAIYQMIDKWTPTGSANTNQGAEFVIPDDSKRVERTAEVMEREASAYRDQDPVIRQRVFETLEKTPKLKFSRFDIPVKEQVFYESKTGNTIGLVNLKPLSPGHVLVVPKRVVPRLCDLSQFEFDDLVESVMHVQTIIGNAHKARGFNVAVQDGKDAGQSVPHVHVHVIPRG